MGDFCDVLFSDLQKPNDAEVSPERCVVGSGAKANAAESECAVYVGRQVSVTQ